MIARALATTAAAAVGTALIAGCAGADSRPGITVFAASSLRPVFSEFAERFQRQYPGTTVTVSYAGSADLLTQLTQGAPADVFAPADQQIMAAARGAGLIRGEPVDFAANSLTIVTPPGNPKGVASFADLADPDTAVVVCAAQVPCGSAARRLQQATGVTLRPVSEESAVADVMGKVVSGQADAGLVYVTDARGAGETVEEVPFAESAEAVNTYPIAVLDQSADPAAARRFIDLVTGEQGRAVLAAAGFAAP